MPQGSILDLVDNCQPNLSADLKSSVMLLVDTFFPEGMVTGLLGVNIPEETHHIFYLKPGVDIVGLILLPAFPDESKILDLEYDRLIFIEYDIVLDG